MVSTSTSVMLGICLAVMRDAHTVSQTYANRQPFTVLRAVKLINTKGYNPYDDAACRILLLSN